MENNKIDSQTRWAKFVDSFDNYMSENPFIELDEVYMTTLQRANMYAEATRELRAEVKVLKEQKKQNNK